MQRGVEGGEDIRAERERHALLARIQAEVQRAWHAVRRRRDRRAVEDNSHARDRGQSLAAGARGKVDAPQIHRRDAEGTDAIQAKPHAARLTHGQQRVNRCGGARARLAMRGPEPLRFRVGVQPGGEAGKVKRAAPFPPPVMVW